MWAVAYGGSLICTAFLEHIGQNGGIAVPQGRGGPKLNRPHPQPPPRQRSGPPGGYQGDSSCQVARKTRGIGRAAQANLQALRGREGGRGRASDQAGGRGEGGGQAQVRGRGRGPLQNQIQNRPPSPSPSRIRKPAPLSMCDRAGQASTSPQVAPGSPLRGLGRADRRRSKWEATQSLQSAPLRLSMCGASCQVAGQMSPLSMTDTESGNRAGSGGQMAPLRGPALHNRYYGRIESATTLGV